MANAVLRFVIEGCRRFPRIAKLTYRVKTYNCRKTTGGGSWSAHSWPIAIDINPSGEPVPVGEQLAPLRNVVD